MLETIVHDGSQTLRAQKAVLLYGADHHRASYCSIHEVTEKDDNGALQINAGVAASVSGLRHLFAELDPVRKQVPTFNETRVLSSGPSWQVWWVKPTRRRVWFNASKIGKRSAETPHPALIFAVTPKGWHVFAIRSSTRPRPGTRLYQAPYFNVWEGGAICSGSARVPDTAHQDDLDAWEQAFFESEFTHPNIHAPGVLTRYKGGPVKLWKALLDGKHEHFPKESLVPMNATVKDLLTRIGREI